MDEQALKTVTIGVSSIEETKRQANAAFRGDAQGAHLSFSSVELLWKTLSPKRWDLLRAMTGGEPMALREIARRIGRDVKAVHGDVHALLDAGVLDRAEDGRLIFPYDAIHVDFTLRAA